MPHAIDPCGRLSRLFSPCVCAFSLRSVLCVLCQSLVSLALALPHHLSLTPLVQSFRFWQEVASGSALGNEISAIIREGQIVKSETTVALLRSAMSGRDGPFLIDGFPRSISNLEAFEAEMGQAAFMLFLEVSEAQMEKRLLNRGRTSGRSDDNRDTITKRFRTFVCDSMPVIDALRERDCVRFVDAGGSPDEVFASVCEAFADQQLDE